MPCMTVRIFRFFFFFSLFLKWLVNSREWDVFFLFFFFFLLPDDVRIWETYCYLTFFACVYPNIFDIIINRKSQIVHVRYFCNTSFSNFEFSRPFYNLILSSNKLNIQIQQLSNFLFSSFFWSLCMHQTKSISETYFFTMRMKRATKKEVITFSAPMPTSRIYIGILAADEEPINFSILSTFYVNTHFNRNRPMWNVITCIL